MTGFRLLTPRLFTLLLKVDQDIAEEARGRGCPRCGGVLHSARYPRSPRGLPAGVPVEDCYRLSYCCNKDGCRHRVTPPSVRFIGPKHFVGTVVVLLTALRQGPTPTSARKLQRLLGVSERTLRRWQRWWQEVVPKTRFWKVARGRLRTPVNEQRIIFELLTRFNTGRPLRDFGRVLRFLAPLDGRSAVAVHACGGVSLTPGAPAEFVRTRGCGLNPPPPIPLP